jgi:hypothetical protein
MIGLAILLILLITYLMIGNLAGLTDAGEWLTMTYDGSFKIMLPDDSGTGMTINGWSLYLVLFHRMILVAVWIYILRLLQTVISSVDNLKTFQSKNIIAFRYMGFAFLLLAAISLITVQSGDDSTNVSFSLKFGYLVLAAGAFLLSEVFKEGHNLYEQNRLMI